MVELYFHLLFGVISCTLLLLPTGLGPALRLIGLILVEKQTVEDLCLTTVTVIEHYWARGTWILIDISERLNRVRCVRPPIQWAAVCVCWLMELELKRNRQGSLENDFFLLKPPVQTLLQARYQFTLFTPIKALYLNTSSMCSQRSRGQRSNLHPPRHLALFPAQFPGCKWSHVVLNTYG